MYLGVFSLDFAYLMFISQRFFNLGTALLDSSFPLAFGQRLHPSGSSDYFQFVMKLIEFGFVI